MCRSLSHRTEACSYALLVNNYCKVCFYSKIVNFLFLVFLAGESLKINCPASMIFCNDVNLSFSYVGVFDMASVRLSKLIRLKLENIAWAVSKWAITNLTLTD